MSRILYSSAMPRVVPLTEARASLSDLLDAVEHEHEQVLITRNGKPVGLLVSPDEWESMEETIEILGDPEAMARLAESERDVEAGRVYEWEDVKRDLGLA